MYSAEGSYEEAKVAISQLPNDNDIMRTAKEIYTLYFDQLTNDAPMRHMSMQKRERLKELAQLCPFTHGTAVYVARSMARFYEKEWVNYRNLCETGTPWIGARLKQEQALKVYPNPFTDRVQIESSGVSVAVYGILGKLHFEQAVQSNQKTVLLLSALPAGVYVLKVFDAFGEELGSEKLIKTR